MPASPKDNALVAVPKEVERAGKTFTQRYWVKVADVANDLKAEGWESKKAGHTLGLMAYEAVAKKLGADPDLTAGLSRSWTSTTQSPNGVKAQAAVAQLLGWKAEDVPLSKTSNSGSMFTEHFKLPEGSAVREKYQKAVEASYAMTQAALLKGPDTYRLYRGVAGEQAKAVFEAAKGLADQGIKYEDAKIAVGYNPISCFSEKQSTAASFGSGGLVFHVDVPKEAILWSHKISPGHVDSYKGEAEMTVMTAGDTELTMHQLGGATGKKIHDYFASKGLVSGSEPGVKPPAPPVKVQIKSTHADLSEHLKSSGGTVLSTSGSKSWEPNVEIPADKVEEFAEKFAQTPSFDAKTKSVADLKSYLKGKVQEAETPTSTHGAVGMWTPPPPKAGYQPEKTTAAPSVSVSNEATQEQKAPPYRHKWKAWAVSELGVHGGTKNLSPTQKEIYEKTVKQAKDYLSSQKKTTKAGLKAFIKKTAQEHAATAGIQTTEKVHHPPHEAQPEHVETAIHHALAEPAQSPTTAPSGTATHKETVAAGVKELAAEHGAAKVEKYFADKASSPPPYRYKWGKWAEASMKKAGVPSSEMPSKSEKVTAEAKLFLAKKHLAGEKADKAALKAFIKGKAGGS